ncbi:hypothetical protein BDQ12DRAFT_669674 [Crucibulum laeve]|uniref:Galactose oxidase n=1 Tax=Crucibulum laeve TaxID=68775 RepID=A0A5C3LQ61_9AGAR|nr:hypothetical protein BDQ12DRAFT_669674 [Crucibulum laeve]
MSLFSKEQQSLAQLPANVTAIPTPSQGFAQPPSTSANKENGADQQQSGSQRGGSNFDSIAVNGPWSARQLVIQPPKMLPKSSVLPPTYPYPSPFPRYGHSIPANATPSGDLYLFGGLVADSARNDLYIFSTSNNAAALVQTDYDIPSPRVGHASALVSSVLIVWGGDTKTDPMEGSSEEKQDDGLYLLNLVSREWTRVAVYGAVPDGRYGHTMTISGSKFIIFGVRTRATWELYEPASAEKPAQRTGHICVTYEESIIVFGGTDGQYHYNDTWSFDLQIMQWSELKCIGSVPSPREGHAAAIVDDVIYVFRGRGVDGKDLGDLAAFNISNQQWYTFPNMGTSPSARSGHAMASVGSEVFVLGGESFPSPKSDDMSTTYVLDTRDEVIIKEKQSPSMPRTEEEPQPEISIAAAELPELKSSRECGLNETLLAHLRQQDLNQSAEFTAPACQGYNQLTAELKEIKEVTGNLFYAVSNEVR